MRSHSSVRPSIALVLLAVITSACAGGRDEGTTAREPTATPSATASVGSSPSETGAARAPDAPGVATGSPAPSAEAEGAQGEGTGAAPHDPPRSGTYTYRQSGRSTFGAFTFESEPQGTLEVGSPSGNAGTRRQRHVRRFSEQREREQSLLFRSDGVYVEEVVERFGFGAESQEIRCRLEKPLLALRLPLKIGSSWTDEGRCDGMTIRIRGSVVRQEKRGVGSRSVDTFLVRGVAEVEGNGFRQASRSDAWVSPEHRLVVRSSERAEGTYQGQPYERSLTDQLASLEPRR